MIIPKQNNIIGYWKGIVNQNGTLEDSSGNENHGTLVSSPTQVNTPFGSALDYDGIADYVNIGDPAVLRITGALTLSVVIKSNDNVNEQGIISRWGIGVGERQYQLRVDGTGKLTFNVSANGTTSAVTVTDPNTVTPLLQHVVGTYDPSNSAALYINDVRVALDVIGVPASLFDLPSRDVHIGECEDHREFNGIILHSIIYDTALDRNEVSQLYQAMQRLTARR